MFLAVFLNETCTIRLMDSAATNDLEVSSRLWMATRSPSLFSLTCFIPMTVKSSPSVSWKFTMLPGRIVTRMIQRRSSYSIRLFQKMDTHYSVFLKCSRGKIQIMNTVSSKRIMIKLPNLQGPIIYNHIDIHVQHRKLETVHLVWLSAVPKIVRKSSMLNICQYRWHYEHQKLSQYQW